MNIDEKLKKIKEIDEQIKKFVEDIVVDLDDKNPEWFIDIDVNAGAANHHIASEQLNIINIPVKPIEGVYHMPAIRAKVENRLQRKIRRRLR